MREDESLDLQVEDLALGRFGGEQGTINSLSGHERNKLFVACAAPGGFLDLSMLAGLDSEADGRALAVLDFDRDGWPDLAVTNANAPRLQLFRNLVGAAGGTARAHRSIDIELVGANDTARPAPGRSARDAIGARVRVDVGGRSLHRTLAAGEGFAAQNEARLLVGLGTAEGAERVVVRWPGGAESEVTDVEAGTTLRVWEDPAQSPGGRGSTARPRPTLPRPPGPRRAADDERLALVEHAPPAELVLFTSMATWCASCRAELPQLQTLRAAFDPGELALQAIPVDAADTPELLERWQAEHAIAAPVRGDLPREQIDGFARLLRARLRSDTLPASALADGQGRLLEVRFGLPTVSELRAALAELRAGR